MKRVLFISYFFPPLANSGTQRSLKFANYLPDYGWEPIVLTVEQPPADDALDPTLLDEVRPGTRVVRAPMFNHVIADAIGRAAAPVADPRWVSSAIRWRLRHRHQMPDLYAWWRPTATRTALRIFRATGFDAIFATGFPWTSLLVARDVARQTGRPFIADFRDPWTGEDVFMPPQSVRTRRRQLALERSVLDAAAGVVTLAGLLTDEVKALSPQGQNRVVTITNGFDARDLMRVRLAPVPPPATCRIVYTGVWKDGYGLGSLYNAIAELDRTDPNAIANLEVIAAGFEPGYAHRFGVEKYVRETGRLSHTECIGYMQTADLLYLPVAAGKRQKLHLPGKLYEYAASGRPILAVAHPEGELAAFLEEVGGGVVITPDDQPALVRSLRQLCRDGRLSAPAVNPNALARYERRALAGRLANLLDSAVA